MNLLLKIAFRNMLRNLRRSLMTGSAVAARRMSCNSWLAVPSPRESRSSTTIS